MQTASEILNFNFSAAVFSEAANKIFHATLQRLIEKRTNDLHKLTERIGASQYEFSGASMIPEVFTKFKALANSGSLPIGSFDLKELKTLSFSLSHFEHRKKSIFSKTSELEFAIQTFESSWRDSYLIGLVDCYLRNWENQKSESSATLCRFIISKLKTYNGGRVIINSLKKNLKYFENNNGDVVLGSDLALNNKQINEATKYLSLPENWFSYPYFSRVIVAYYEKRKDNIQQFIDDLLIALNEHNSDVSNKRLVSKLIIQANSNEFAALQDKIKNIAVKLVGDPGNSTNWAAFENATETEKQDLKNARNILNEWITQQFINVFFEKCINDSRRKRFWLKYTKEITQFRVVGSTYIKRVLQNDNRISELVSPRFSKTNSRNDSNAALMFIMRSHLFIEFSDEGAFYAYKLSNTHAPSIEEPFFFSTGSLKTTSMPWLAYRSGWNIYSMSEEGRLGHTDGDLSWEDVAVHWLKNKIGIDV